MMNRDQGVVELGYIYSASLIKPGRMRWGLTLLVQESCVTRIQALDANGTDSAKINLI